MKPKKPKPRFVLLRVAPGILPMFPSLCACGPFKSRDEAERFSQTTPGGADEGLRAMGGYYITLSLDDPALIKKLRPHRSADKARKGGK